MYDWADGIAQLWSRCKVGATAQSSDLRPESLNRAPEGCSQPAEAASCSLRPGPFRTLREVGYHGKRSNYITGK